jgi:acetoacetyl-CoA synthetase
MNQPLWQPSSGRIAAANLTAFAHAVAARHGQALRDYAKLRAWSVEQSADFWAEFWQFAEVRASRPCDAVLKDGARMPGARWFAGAELNFDYNLLR